ncbi:hypothetical protein DTO280E4_199 [Paecilomyces variotii]|nr:hypothetical protein DTO280E4_199 [Paecilomyces variotii]KAJ9408681.1 hypothetical protein DTO045G8_3629 [Paecilomyces variotii]
MNESNREFGSAGFRSGRGHGSKTVRCGCNVVLSPEIWICRVWRNLQATSIFPNPTEGMNLTLIIWKLCPTYGPAVALRSTSYAI